MEWCSVCNGSGKVVAGYGVVCTEIVEKVEKYAMLAKGKDF